MSFLSVGMGILQQNFSKLERFIFAFATCPLQVEKGTFSDYSLRYPSWSKPYFVMISYGIIDTISIGVFCVHCGRAREYVETYQLKKILSWSDTCHFHLHFISQDKLFDLCWILEGGKCSFKLLSKKRKRSRNTLSEVLTTTGLMLSF